MRGTVADISGQIILVDVGGVGYEVFSPDSVVLQMPPTGGEVELWTRQVFREDGTSLYGFIDQHQRRVFDMLVEVKGCGPKIGLALLGQVGEDQVIAAILSQDARVLARATGVGARLAERILLELKDKVQEEALRRKIETSGSKSTPTIAPKSNELVDALLALGYRRSEAEAAAEKSGDGPLEEQLRSALKVLAR